ncbi:hypothetical protein [Thaumasiovibrio subtropicus]|uniref:hypothetical protein n=1 Tax=Thaumasiovibrio subtropicus TaxID=1891207 RepID=UPI000B35626F|nr:hypothetical protein [Thaumasiovibrio subtropicus]
MENALWSQWHLEARLSALSSWAEQHGLLALLQQDCEQALTRMMEPELLVGPTGEANELYLVPRGVFIASQTTGEAETQALRALIGRALLAGNRIQLDSSVNEHLAGELLALGFQLPEGTLVSVPDARIGAEHAGVIAVGDMAHQQTWQRSIAALSGAIVPVIASHGQDTAVIDPMTALQWVHERTRTNNVTAIGGNASLLALND